MTKRADEFIFEFQKLKYAHKVLEVLIGSPEKRNVQMDNKNSVGSVENEIGNEKESVGMCK